MQGKEVERLSGTGLSGCQSLSRKEMRKETAAEPTAWSEVALSSGTQDRRLNSRKSWVTCRHYLEGKTNLHRRSQGEKWMTTKEQGMDTRGRSPSVRGEQRRLFLERQRLQWEFPEQATPQSGRRPSLRPFLLFLQKSKSYFSPLKKTQRQTAHRCMTSQSSCDRPAHSRPGGPSRTPGMGSGARRPANTALTWAFL